ncbi:fatty acid desaturase family protein [Nostoc sp. C117]|uniref:fatty acid desaturase family protein n=1 Tax=Nostoc sp. C117 TaxID=3349875 RepID=UPI00370D09EB
MKLTNHFSDKSNHFAFKLLILVILSSTFVTAILLVSGPVKLVPQILLGLMFAHSVELIHELGHHVLFFNERINRWLGVVLGFPMLVSFSRYKALHGFHHRALGTPEDKESFNYSYESLTSLPGFLFHLSMLGHYSNSLNLMRASVFGEIREENVPSSVLQRIRNEFRLMAALLLIMLVLSIWLQTSIFVDIWLIPLLLSASIAHALIELPEHLGCDSKTTNLFQNTRTIRTSKLMNWYVNGNNFHVEHHINPSWPIDRLSELHNQVALQIEHLEPSYWAFYRKFLSNLYHRSVRQKNQVDLSTTEFVKK